MNNNNNTTASYPRINGREVEINTAPSSLVDLLDDNSITKLARGSSNGGDCSICLDSLSSNGPVIQLKGCGHMFHEKCFKQCIDSLNKNSSSGSAANNNIITMNCMMCRDRIDNNNEASWGRCPSGTMKIEVSDSILCPGFMNTTMCIRITYSIPSGTQASYHPHPGKEHLRARRVTYLSDNDDGRALLGRLRYAFRRGLIFDVGTSQTSGRSDSVVWSTSIPHKTSLHGGPFGFPDSNYISECNRKLDALNVPNATRCLSSSNSNSNSTTAPSDLPDSSTNAFHPRPSVPPQPNAHPQPSAPPRHPMPFITMPANSPQAFNFIVSQLFNGTLDTVATAGGNTTNSPGGSAERIEYIAPDTLVTGDLVSQELLPLTRSCFNKDDNETCPICFDALSKRKSVHLKGCHHRFHEDCVTNALRQNDPRCPVCRVRIGKIQGSGPRGTMTIKPIPVDCPGFSSSSIQIIYELPTDIQKPYHENPGVPYMGTVRIAFLPDTYDGRRVLARLRYAWMHGLTFQIGTSLTTGMGNVVIWSSIHHKTSLSGGVHGFPDPNYIINVNEALSALGVPDADSCGSGPGE